MSRELHSAQQALAAGDYDGAYGAYLEHEGPTYVTFRGQGGEEIAMATREANGGTTIRASTLLYDQAIGRFFSTLPLLTAGEQGAA